MGKKTKKDGKSRYTNPDGSFKKMFAPGKSSGAKNKFNGCVRYQMNVKNLSEERAEKLCGYIKKQKYGGDGLYDKFDKNINLEKNAHHLSIEEDGTYLTFFLHDLSSQAQEDVLKFLGVRDLDELGDEYTPLLKIQEPEYLESSAYERLMVGDKKITAQFGEFELYFDDLITQKKNELLAFLGMNDPSEGNFDRVPIAIVEQEPSEEDLVIHRHMGPRSKKEGEKYHPPTTEELKVDPSGSVDVFLSEKTPQKGSDVSKAWESWCDEKKLSDEAEEKGMNILRGRGFKVSEVEEVTTTSKSSFDRFMEKKEAMFKRGWTIEKQKISEGEHKRRLDKIRAYEKDIARELSQEEAEEQYYKLGKGGISQL